jgi:hypothetical protein
MLTHANKHARSVARQSRLFCRRRRAGNWAGLTYATATAAVATVIGAALIATPALAMPQAGHAPHYQFRTIDNNNDPTFNQLLGINQQGEIAGYLGSGAHGHPNKGYVLMPSYRQRNFLPENFPRSAQTQVTGLNDDAVTVGFWSDMNSASGMNDNIGFYSLDGRFHSVSFPTNDNASPAVNQLLGVNDDDLAAGFYVDSEGNSHGYTYSIRRHRFSEVMVPGATSVTAAAINNWNDVAGFATDAGGHIDGFVMTAGGTVTTLDYPGATMTQAFGVNDSDEVVGVYQVGTGDSAMMHGFTWTPLHGFQTVDDPNGAGATTINGVNDSGQLVGFYTDAAGNTDGLLASPVQHRHR